MSKVDDDFLNTIFVLEGINEGNYNKLFFSSNELLFKIFSNFNVCGKNVLTVLGSGDQAFHCYKNGAKSVDLFDINPLTIYYYYLRRWVVEYLGQFYPDKDFTNHDIKQLLKNVVIHSDYENDAIQYWGGLTNLKFFSFRKLFFREIVKQKQGNEFNNLSVIKKRMSDDYSFYNIDLTNKVNINKKYDVIITSNISEYVHPSSLSIYKENLANLMSDNGRIVCSNLRRNGVDILEKTIFEDSFTFNSMNKDVSWGKMMSLGYIYKRK